MRHQILQTHKKKNCNHKMLFKDHQNKLVRLQTSQNRDLKNGIILDRNERADSYNNLDFKKALNSFSINSFNATPDISALYKKIANLHKVKTDNIYITQGITECMSHVIFSFLNKNDEAIIMHPSYPMYDVLLKLHNIKYKLWKFSNKFDLRLSDLKKIINKKTKVLFLVNPNMPIEYEFSSKFKNEIYKICKKNNILLVYDEAYYHFGSVSEANKIRKNKNLIVMRTFSKAWGLSGIRLGYMIADKKLCEYVSKCRKRILRYIPQKGLNILDFASGPIQYKEYLLYSKNYKYRHCVDFSKDAIMAAKAKIGKSNDDGLVQRLQLLVFPDMSNKPKEVERAEDEEAQKSAFSAIQGLRSIDPIKIGVKPFQDDDRSILHFDEDAQKIFDGFRRFIENRVVEGKEDDTMSAHLNKLPATVAKLAMLIHLIDQSYGDVDKETTLKAIRFGHYLYKSAKRVYFSADVGIAEVATILGKRLRAGALGDQFTVSEVKKKGWGKLRETETIEAAVAALVAAGWIRKMPLENSLGRPADRYIVNPQITGG